jgi:predicted transcriptional regulator
MEKATTLSPLQSSQMRAFLKSFEENEPVPISPDSKWNIFLACGLTQSVFRKSLNTLAVAGHGWFEAGSGTVNFFLTAKGKKWLKGGRP